MARADVFFLVGALVLYASAGEFGTHEGTGGGEGEQGGASTWAARCAAVALQPRCL
jgi:hypothetical protein